MTSEENTKLISVSGSFDSSLDPTEKVKGEENKIDDGILAHSEFMKEYLSVRKYILEAVNEENEVNQIFISGFSVAGAVANICALDLSLNIKLKSRKIKYNLITIGAPKAGNEPFADQLSNTIKGFNLRFVFNNDIVPKSPPSPYVHSGTKVVFENTSTSRCTSCCIKFPFKCSKKKALKEHNKVYYDINKEFLKSVFEKYDSKNFRSVYPNDKSF
eukprot:CAMPEP_0170534534 /NCGR_PEP_ID=MMETSP0209-20121228/92330_1 /TAXON_ID=665100 ORGANISM="Litonotus pictus, Strain P1" /NCGR_SAMPLE_ID=MMETSP0209 /ASSEMBLY_ACC=CAM_ASM_000301 /LENGTH=215 /DNA_ID=CAMNT_0010834071 /DNA_START=269 /DNA_END=913 /DNA_ORIENTATION=+